MANQAVVLVDQQLRLKVSTTQGQSLTVGLNRIQAQQLSDALLEYAGITHKSYSRGRSTGIVALDYSERRAAPEKTPVVRLSGGSKKLPVVRLR